MRLSAVTGALLVMTALAVLLAVTVGCAGGSGAAGTGGVKWLNDSDEALSRAQAENKPVVINFYTDVCPACRTMDAMTFANSTVGAFLNANFICLKSNAGTTSLQAGYDIRAVPTTVFNVPYGYGKDYEIVRIVGAAYPARFYPLAQAVLEEWQRWIAGGGGETGQ